MSEAARKEILDLLAEGKINANDAAEMLAAVKAKKAETAASETTSDEIPVEDVSEDTTHQKEEAPPGTKAEREDDGRSARWFRVQVSQLSTGKRKVSVNIPLRLVEFGFDVADKFTPETAEWRSGELKEMIREGLTGTLVDVEDEVDDEHVKIYID